MSKAWADVIYFNDGDIYLVRGREYLITMSSEEYDYELCKWIGYMKDNPDYFDFPPSKDSLLDAAEAIENEIPWDVFLDNGE